MCCGGSVVFVDVECCLVSFAIDARLQSSVVADLGEGMREEIYIYKERRKNSYKEILTGI